MGIKVPFIRMAFSPNPITQGPSIQPYKMLVMGQKLAAGSATANEVVDLNSVSEAKTLFGTASDLAFMVQSILKNNRSIDLYALPLDDAGAGTAATGKLTVAAGSATKAGSVYLYIAGRRIVTTVAVGDDQDAVAAAIVAAIAAYTDDMLPVTAAVNGVNANEVDLTANHKGETGNKIDIRFNYQAREYFPEGIVISVTSMASGATNPTLTTALGNLGDTQYNVVAIPWVDATSLAAIKTTFDARWDETVAKEGQVISCQFDSLANLKTLGNTPNAKHITIIGVKSLPGMPLEIAAAATGIVSKSAAENPSIPFQTSELVGILPPAVTDSFTETERDELLNNGIATIREAAGSVMVIDRLNTTYKEDAGGNPDESYFDLNRMFQISYTRFDARTRLGKYTQYALIDDDQKLYPGVKAIRPKDIKALFVSFARGWAKLAIITDLDQFIRDLVVAVDPSEPNRVNIYLAPNYANQFRQANITTEFYV